MDTEYAQLLTSMVIKPLRSVIGRSLLSVVYYVLSTDFPGFDADTANTSGGCQGVHLKFDGQEVEVDWDWQRALVVYPDDLISPPLAYHLVARPTSMRQSAVCETTEDDINGLAAIEATSARPWNFVQGERLLGVSVWGVPLPDSRYSPQAVEFLFPSGEAVVTIGVTHPLSITNGDEVLVFTGPEWIEISAVQTQGWLVRCWQLPAE